MEVDDTPPAATAPTGRSDPRLAAAALAVALAALVLGVIRLDRRPFWVDEAFNVVLVRDGWVYLIKTIVNQEPSQAIYLVFLKPYLALAGDDEWVARLPSVVGAAAACGLLVLLGARLFDRATGVLAGVFLATNAAVLEWEQFARTYAWAVLATVVTTALFVRALADVRALPWVLYGVAAGLSVYMHFYAGFVLVAHALAYCAAPSRAPVRRLLLAWGVAAVALVPFGAYIVTGTRSTVEWIPDPSLDEVRDAIRFASGFNLVLLGLAAAGVVVLLRRLVTSERWKLVLVAGWVVCPLVCGVAFSLVKPAFVDRFLIVAAPGVALLAAAAATSVRRVAIRAVVVAAVLAVAAVRVVDVYTSTVEDWRAAGAAARAAHADGASVAVLPRFAWRSLSLYAPDVPRVDRPGEDRLALIVQAGSGDRERTLTHDFFGRQRYVLLTSRPLGSNLLFQEWVRSRDQRANASR